MGQEKFLFQRVKNLFFFPESLIGGTSILSLLFFSPPAFSSGEEEKLQSWQDL